MEMVRSPNQSYWKGTSRYIHIWSMTGYRRKYRSSLIRLTLMGLVSLITVSGKWRLLTREAFSKKTSYVELLTSSIKYIISLLTLLQDKSGSINASEIKNILGVGKKFGDEKIWDDIINEVDKNGDGEISYEEFKFMMEKFLGDEAVIGKK